MEKKKVNTERPIKVPRFESKHGFSTTPKRSKIMAKIKGKETKPEILFRKYLWHSGIRYRKNVKSLPGKPDIVIRKYKLVIFIDGQFWHGYKWEEKKKKLKSNRAFWIPKIERNIQRDRENEHLLKSLGFKIFRFWDFEICKNLEKCAREVNDYIINFNRDIKP